MKRCSLLLAATLTACHGRTEVFHVAPDNKHVLIGSGTSLRSIDVDTLAEMGRATDVDPGSPFFSADGSAFVARSTRGTLVVVPTAGGQQVELGPAADRGAISIDGTRVAFLRNPDRCPSSYEFCAELFSAPSAGGEAVRVASGIPVQTVYDPRNAGSAYTPYPYHFAGKDTVLFTNVDRGLMSVLADGSAAPVLLGAGIVRSPGQLPVPPAYWVLRDGRVIVHVGADLVLMDKRGGAGVRIADGRSTLFCDQRSRPTVVGPCALSAAGALGIVTQLTASTASVQLLSLAAGASFTVTVSGKHKGFDSDGRFVFFDADGLLSQALPSGEIRQLGRPPSLEEFPGVVSPDGKWASFWSQMQGVLCAECNRVQLLSTVTSATWTAPLFAVSNWAFSPDSRSLLFRTPDRRLYVAPTDGGGDPQLIETDVDLADWAGSDHIVMSRARSSPEGVSILRVR
jgi:hypothetical protein